MGVIKQRFGQRNYRYTTTVKELAVGDTYAQQELKRY